MKNLHIIAFFLSLTLIASAFILSNINVEESAEVNVEESTEENGYSNIIYALADSGVEFYENSQEKDLLALRKVFLVSGINTASIKRATQSICLLNELDPDTPIDLYIRSDGGWEDDAFMLIDVIQSSSAPVNTHALGGVYSAGLMISVSATGERIAYPHTLFGYHAVTGNEEALFENRYLDYIRERTQLTKKYLKLKDGEMYYFDLNESKEMGFYDRLNSSK